MVSAEKYIPKKLKMLPMEFYLDEMYPEVLIHQLSRLYGLPIYRTENGFSQDILRKYLDKLPVIKEYEIK